MFFRKQRTFRSHKPHSWRTYFVENLPWPAFVDCTGAASAGSSWTFVSSRSWPDWHTTRSSGEQSLPTSAVQVSVSHASKERRRKTRWLRVSIYICCNFLVETNVSVKISRNWVQTTAPSCGHVLPSQLLSMWPEKWLPRYMVALGCVWKD